MPSVVAINDKRTINGWAFYDWANSAYALVITTAIFPAYFIEVTQDQIDIFGSSLSNSAFYAFIISAAYLVIAFISPVLSGIADYGGRRMYYLKFFTLIGSLSCIILFFFKGMQQLGLGSICFMIATIGFSGSLVFYNAYLPEIASEDKYDDVSAKGFAFGYIGSVILLLINLVVILKPAWFGIQDVGLATRLAFVMVGLWWIGFAQIPFKRLPKDGIFTRQKRLLSKGFQQLKSVWIRLKKQHNIKRFLIAFFFYSAGVQTVLFLAATFAEKELQFGTSQMILIVIILQLVAIGGAYLFAYISDIKGNKWSLISMLIIWISICLIAYFVQLNWQFYLVASLVGLVMGGIQSLSRSSYSKLIDQYENDHTSYFSFYDVLEKIAIILGTFTFGIVEQLTGGMRNSILTLSVFFVIALIILIKVRLKGV